MQSLMNIAWLFLIFTESPSLLDKDDETINYTGISLRPWELYKQKEVAIIGESRKKWIPVLKSTNQILQLGAQIQTCDNENSSNFLWLLWFTQCKPNKQERSRTSRPTAGVQTMQLCKLESLWVEMSGQQLLRTTTNLRNVWQLEGAIWDSSLVT